MIDKKNIKFRLDVGTFLIFEKESGRSFFTINNDDLQDIGILSNLLYAAAVRADDKVTRDDIYDLNLKELEEMLKVLMQEMETVTKQNNESTLFKFNVREE